MSGLPVPFAYVCRAATALPNTTFSMEKPIMSEQASSQASGHNKTFKIYVNGRERVWTDHRISYEQVVQLAFPDPPANPSTIYSVDYSNPHGHDGTLVAGQNVEVKEEMNFNVHDSGRS